MYVAWMLCNRISGLLSVTSLESRKVAAWLQAYSRLEAASGAARPYGLTSKAKRRESTTRSCHAATTPAKNIPQVRVNSFFTAYKKKDHLRRGDHFLRIQDHFCCASDCSSAFGLTLGISFACSQPQALIAACPSLAAGNANCVLCAPAWKPVRGYCGVLLVRGEGEREINQT